MAELWSSYSSQCYSRTEQETPGKVTECSPETSQIKCVDVTHISRWSLKGRLKVMFSSRRTSPRSINWMPSTCKYQACCYCQNVSLLSIWLCLLYCCAASTPLPPYEAIISPHFKPAISKPDVYSYFIFLLPGGWVKSQPRGHADPHDPERWGAVEIEIWRRPRLRVVLDFRLRARLACFHGSAELLITKKSTSSTAVWYSCHKWQVLT